MLSKSSKVACCVTNEQRIILFVDDAYTELVARPRSELLGRDCLSFTSAIDLRRNDNLLRALQRDGAPFSITKEYIRPDQSKVTVTNHVSALRDGLGPVRLLATCHQSVAVEPEPDPALNRRLASQICRTLILGTAVFGVELNGTPALEVLLLAYLAEVEGRVITADDIANQIGQRPTSARRWTQVLINRGLIDGEDQSLEGGVMPLRIGSQALVKMEALLSGLRHGAIP